jgi:hypothetical protein
MTPALRNFKENVFLEVIEHFVGIARNFKATF